MQWLPDIVSIIERFGVVFAVLVFIAYLYFKGVFGGASNFCKRLQIMFSQISDIHNAIRNPEKEREIIKRADILQKMDVTTHDLFENLEELVKTQCGSSTCPISSLVKEIMSRELTDIKEQLHTYSVENKDHRNSINELTKDIYSLVNRIHDRFDDFTTNLGKDILYAIRVIATKNNRSDRKDID